MRKAIPSLFNYVSRAEMGATGLVVLALMAGIMMFQIYYAPRLNKKEFPKRISINQASAETLNLLPFISQKRARIIDQWRSQHGKIENCHEVQIMLRLSADQTRILERLIQF